MSLRRHLCAALTYFNLHRPDCEHCSVQDCVGIAIRRLRELNEHAQQVSRPKSHGDVTRPEDDAA